MSRKAALTKQAASSDKEPVIVVETNDARKHAQVRAKSSSVESNPSSSALPSIRCSSLVEDEGAFATSDKQPDWGRALSHDEGNQFRWQRHNQLQVAPRAASQESLKGGGGGGGGGGGSSSSHIARRLSSFSKNLLQNPFSPLRPSISTSCLFTTAAASSPTAGCGDQHSKKSTLATAGNAIQLLCVPTRASLTHQWRKLKTLNKCRECNMLVYFNGRECSQCGIIAHKKCMTSLVIKCDYQSGEQTQTYNELGSEKDSRHQTGSWPGLLGSLQVATATASPTVAVFEQQQQQQQQVRAYMRRPQVTQPIFGKPIVNTDTEQVLDFINRFVYEIDTRGLSSKGIYRVSSIKSKVDKLCHYFDHNPSRLIDLSSFHPNIIANALKLYLRRLPEPLLTNVLYGRFIEVAKRHARQSQPVAAARPRTPDFPNTAGRCSTSRSIVRSSVNQDPVQRRQASLVEPNMAAAQQQNESTLDEFRRTVNSLPPVNRNILALIMRHLRRVADMAEENQMSAKNLSIIFGPTLLNVGGQQQDKSSSLAIVDNIHQAHAIELMITWAYQIFPAAPTVEGPDSDSDWQSHQPTFPTTARS